MNKTLIEKVRQAGIVGLGGGGFPTYAKWQNGAEVVIANGAECEPLLVKDRYLMENYPDVIVEGVKSAMDATGAKRGYIAMKYKYKSAITAIEKHTKRGNIEVVRLPDFYPVGDEYFLVDKIIGKRVPPLGYPTEIGVVVNNVETLYFAQNAVNGEPFTHKFISVLGLVKRPGVYKVPIGALIRDILIASGVKESSYRLFMDGLMMGSDCTGDCVVEKTTSALFVLPLETAHKVNPSIPIEVLRRRAVSACENCRMCTDLCPRYLLGYPIEPHRIIRAFSYNLSGDVYDSAIRMAYNCSECGICELYACPMNLSPRQLNRYIKIAYKMKGRPAAIEERREYMTERAVPLGRLIERLAVGDFVVNAEYVSEIEPECVEVPLTGYVGGDIKPIVKKGDRVEEGQVIAESDNEAGVLFNVAHSPVDGRVVSIGERVRIEVV